MTTASIQSIAIMVYLSLLVMCTSLKTMTRYPRIFTASHYRSKLSAHQATSTATKSEINNIQIPKVPSFVNDVMRPYAMKLHTKDQAKEGEQKAQKPFTKWEPSRQDYLQFLIDSKVVYDTFEDIISKNEALQLLRNTGLERGRPLENDIEWMLKQDPSLIRTPHSTFSENYAVHLRTLSTENIPKFICHYYNYYFAHTAGGRMIGKKMLELLWNGQEINFYQWDGDVKTLVEAARRHIDEIASTWNEEEKQACLEETLDTFKYGGGLMSSLNHPEMRKH